MQPDNFFQKLERQLKNQLPGNTSHVKMLPPGRLLQVPSCLDIYRDSAVLILLFPEDGVIKICLIRRPATMKNHAGQIALPGGKRESHDADLIQTALREAHEEIGIDRDAVRVGGQLSPVYVQISDFLITPVIGWLNAKPKILLDPNEVDEVIFISLEDIANEQHLCNKEMETRTGRIFVPGYEINGYFIWGATAMMLAELGDILAGDSQL
jgi:8-oxo-dGTP pyrophosphatase MutT (NUDIX family)